MITEPLFFCCKMVLNNLFALSIALICGISAAQKCCVWQAITETYKKPSTAALNQSPRVPPTSSCDFPYQWSTCSSGCAAGVCNYSLNPGLFTDACLELKSQACLDRIAASQGELRPYPVLYGSGCAGNGDPPMKTVMAFYESLGSVGSCTALTAITKDDSLMAAAIQTNPTSFPSQTTIQAVPTGSPSPTARNTAAPRHNSISSFVLPLVIVAAEIALGH
jgi:hypothetical protein